MRNTKKSVVTLLSAVLISGCVSFSSSIPEGYQGPVVQLADTGYRESNSKGIFYAVMTIDGKDIDNSIRETRAASNGRGSYLVARYTTRPVPVMPMKIKLIGTHQTAAPIHELVSRAAGTFYEVEGVVDFQPVEGRSYIVTGELKKNASCVWIADSQTRQLASQKLCQN